MKMNKKILTLLIAGALLVGASGTMAASAYCLDESCNNESLVNQESTLNKQGPNTHKGNNGKGTLTAYAEMSGLDSEELKEYLDAKDMTLRDLITENSDLDEFNKIKESVRSRIRNKNALSTCAEKSGMDIDKINNYLKDNDMTLKDLTTENGDLKKFRKNMQR
ncbi:MAG TPA: hypothetical protein VJ916_03015 [Anaerovoracaceae bacterium]|nr:hypothetical protein [Anaerovoracaceae bacterium]